MDTFSNLFKEELVFIDHHFEDKIAFFHELNAILLDKGYVNEQFLPRILAREEKYPTGLRTSPFPVAIPHTDPDTIVKPFIAVIIPSEPISFFEMGTDDQQVNVSAIFTLGLHKSASQVTLLQRLIELFMKPEVMGQLLDTTAPSAVLSLLKNQIN